jgi:hypothetical protein
VLGFTGAAGWYSVAALHPIVGHLADKTGSFTGVVMAISAVPLAGAFISLGWSERRKTPGAG